MKIVKLNEVKKSENPHKVDVRKLYDSKFGQVMHIVLKPNEKLIKHITPVDAVFYVLEGKGIVEVGNEKIEVNADTLIDSPAKIPHCWYNESENILRILVIKLPRPTEKTRLL